MNFVENTEIPKVVIVGHVDHMLREGEERDA